VTGPALTAQVNETRRYAVLIVRNHPGHVAFAPKLPEVIGPGQGRGAACRDFKAQLNQHVAGLIARGAPLPEDDVVAVKLVKLDLHRSDPEGNLQ
jgi:hypothetical protein